MLFYVKAKDSIKLFAFIFVLQTTGFNREYKRIKKVLVQKRAEHYPSVFHLFRLSLVFLPLFSFLCSVNCKQMAE